MSANDLSGQMVECEDVRSLQVVGMNAIRELEAAELQISKLKVEMEHLRNVFSERLKEFKAGVDHWSDAADTAEAQKNELRDRVFKEKASAASESHRAALAERLNGEYRKALEQIVKLHEESNSADYSPAMARHAKTALEVLGPEVKRKCDCQPNCFSKDGGKTCSVCGLLI